MEWLALTQLRVKTLADLVVVRSRSVQACHLFGDDPLQRSKFGSAVSLVAGHMLGAGGGQVALAADGSGPLLRATLGPRSAVDTFDGALLDDLVGWELTADGLVLTIQPNFAPVSRDELRFAAQHLVHLAPDVGATASVVRENKALHGAIADLDRETRRTTALSHRLALRNDDLNMFASAAGHDLREPIAVVKLYSSLLLKQIDGGDLQAARESVSTIQQAAEHARAMLQGLSAYGRLADEKQQTSEPANTNATVARVLAVLSDRIERTSAVVEVKGSLPALPLPEEQLAQVLQNVVSNSLKFSDGPPEVEITGLRRARRVGIRISDRGIGIPEQALRKVLRMFGRAHPERPGTGVGLALVARIVEAHGGQLDVSSEEGVGTTVALDFPWQ